MAAMHENCVQIPIETGFSQFHYSNYIKLYTLGLGDIPVIR